MKTLDYINANIGKYCTLNGNGDFMMNKWIFRETHNEQLKIVKITKSGLVYLECSNGKFYSVPPKNIDIIGN